MRSQSRPCDHLTKAATWKFRTRSFSPVKRIQCTPSVLEIASTREMRIADSGDRRSTQAEKSDKNCQIEETPFFLSSNFFFPASSNEHHHVHRLGLASSKPQTMHRIGWSLSLTVRWIYVTTPNWIFFEPDLAKWDHLRNKTTFWQSLWWL